ncbi:MAG: HEAT repeat domain-containing protein [Candidatus Aminicenantes bacterium]
MKENSKKNEHQNISRRNENRRSTDPHTVAEVKEIIHLLAKTVSLVKIFPPDHSSVRNFTQEISDKLASFLQENFDLEIDIKEFSFHFQGENVYEEKNPVKSLPFLFFKDGAQKIFFHKGLKKDQLLEFLETIKKYYELPSKEADIVSLLWEKDLAHISLLAPDDFLETRIGAGGELTDFKIDREALQAGTIELAPEDKKSLSSQDLTSHFMAIEPEKLKQIDQDEKLPGLSRRESQALKIMLETNRKLSPDEELAFLILEMLYLEENPQLFSSNLDTLAHSLKDILQKGNFSFAGEVLDHILELRQILCSQSLENVESIDAFIQKIKAEESLDPIKENLLKGHITDFDSFFAFWKFLGPEVLPVICELFEKIKSPSFRHKASLYLQEMGKDNYQLLMDMANQERPALTKAVIGITGTAGEKKVIPFLASFISSPNKSIKKAAVEALGKIEDVIADKILLGFLGDEDQDLRILAAQNLHSTQDSSIISPVINLTEKKPFKKKTKKEKQSVLDALARSKSSEACACLQELMRKSTLFGRRKQTETRLCAVKALEKMGTAQAVDILNRGTHLRNKKVKRACGLALDRISLSESSKNIR